MNSAIRSIKQFFSAILFSSILVNICWAIPLDTAAPSTTDQARKQWQTIAAKNALDIGLFHLAENLYTEILQHETDPNKQQAIGLQLASTLINQTQYAKANEILDQLPQKNVPEAKLLRAIASFSSNADLSKKLIEQINTKDLPPDYQPWLFITKGLFAEANHNLKEAKKAFQEAATLALSENLKLHIDVLLFRIQNSSEKGSETLEKSLKKKLEKSKNGLHATTLKQYAIVLDELGKKTEAIDVLEASLEKLSFKEKNETDSIIFLAALIAGPETEKGRLSLETVIERKQDLELSKAALSILTQQINHTNAQSYLTFLSKLIDNPQQHPLIDTLLIHRAQLALFLGQNESAQIDATRLLDEYPGSIHNSKANRILAYIAWNSDPPRYRTAADILTKLAEASKDEHERDLLNNLAADSYFLNHDYTNAARLYTTLLQDTAYKLPKGPLLYQLILCIINQQNLTAAEHILDKFRNNPHIDPNNLWRAEWNLINSMKNQGQIDKAFTRIQKLLTSPPLPITEDLKLRLLWLQAELSFESDNPEKTSPSLTALLNLLTLSDIDPEQKTLIASHALLLKAQALLALKKEEEALKIIQELRESYPNTKPTILSYIIEARHYASINNPTKAQQHLINLSDSHPDSEYAAISLYEAALNAESRGLKNTYQEALAILERINSAYPNSPLAYYARFKQGDILRKLGDFSNAQLVYENLIKQYPDHPEKPRCELALLDCIFAQASNNQSALNDVAAQYTQLSDSPLLPENLRAEAGFKAGFALTKASLIEPAQEAFWLTISNLLINPKNDSQLNDQGKYWIARCIFELASLLEKTGSTQEANEVYQLISSFKLPGSALANSKIK